MKILVKLKICNIIQKNKFGKERHNNYINYKNSNLEKDHAYFSKLKHELKHMIPFKNS